MAEYETNNVVTRYNAKKKKRQKRRKFVFYSMLTVFFVLLITVLSVTVFFNINDIAVTGNEKYSNDEVIAASGLEKGGNLFRINKFKIIDSMYEKLPYASKITIDRHLPVGIEIIIEEAKPYFYTEVGGCYYLVSETLKVLEMTAVPPQTLPFVTGLENATVKVGEVMTDEEGICNRLNTLTGALKKYIGDDCVTAIDVSLSYELTFEYLGRIKVNVGTAEKIDFKLQLVSRVIDQNNKNENAVIDVSDGEFAYYRAADTLEQEETEEEQEPQEEQNEQKDEDSDTLEKEND
jgi:cell division protein FtsQ